MLNVFKKIAKISSYVNKNKLYHYVMLQNSLSLHLEKSEYSCSMLTLK